MENSLIGILSLIKSFSEAHWQLKRFKFESSDRFDLHTEDDVKFPLIYINYISTDTLSNSIQYTLNIRIVDLLNDDRSNYEVILNNTNLIGTDFSIYFGDENDELPITIIGDVSFNEITDSGVDNVAGIEGNVIFEVKRYNICKLPLDDVDIVLSGCDIVLPKRLTCETLSDCQTIEEIIDDIESINATFSNYATINYVDTGTASIWSYLSTFSPTSATPSLYTVLSENNSASFSTITNLGTGSNPYDAVNLNQLNNATASIYNAINNIPISATPSLAAVLKAGNNAGTYSIIQDNSIISSDGNSQIDMGANGGYLALTSDGQAYLEPYMYITNQNIFGYPLGVLGDQNFKISVGAPGIWVNNYLHGSSTLLDLNHSTAVLITTPQLQIVNGSEGLGKVLTSDAAGIATWQTISIPAGLFEMSSGSASIISVFNALSGGTASSVYAIAMGESNDASGYNTAAIGGINNNAGGGASFIGGGQNILVSNVYGGAIAGFNNTLNGNYGFMAGGAYNTISNSGGLILCSSESKVIADGAAIINSSYATASGTQSIILGVNNFIGTQSYTTYMTNLYTTGRGDITTYLSVGGRDIMAVNGTTSSAIISAHSNENDTAELEIHRHSSSTNRGSTIYGARSRGTVGSETIVNSDDNLLDIIAVGFDGSDYAISSGIYFEVDGTASTNDMPGRIVFKTSPDGTQIPVEAFRLSNDKLAHFSGEVRFGDRTYYDVYTASVSGTTYSIDCSLSNYQVLTFASDCQLSYTNPKVGHYNIVCVATASRALGLTTSGGWYAPAGIRLGFDNDVILMQMIYDGSRMIVSTYENLNEII